MSAIQPARKRIRKWHKLRAENTRLRRELERERKLRLTFDCWSELLDGLATGKLKSEVPTMGVETKVWKYVWNSYAK